MKLAASTLFCMDKPLEEALEEAVKLNSRRIEVADSGHHALNEDRMQMLLEAKEEYGLEYSVHAPYSDTNLSADDPSIRESIIERIKTSVDYAETLDAIALVFHPGWRTPVDPFMPGRTWRLNLESARRIMEYASCRGVDAMIENVPDPRDFLMKTVSEFRRFFKELEMESEMVLDVAHANIRGEIYDFIDEFKDRIGHVHVSDNNGARDMHLQVGVGSIDWEHVIEELQNAGFEGWIVVESYSGVRESIEYLEELIY
ncbi:MAG: sugar phosphate isomerase/epimerase family protein [Candidatus Bathyarchaeia archaeon]